MRYRVGGVLAAVLLGASSACGVLSGGGDTGKVCADTKQAFQQYVTRVRSVSAAEPGQWREATGQLAGRLDGLAGKTDDAALKKALKTEADRLRSAATAVGTGDASQLNAAMNEAPAQIGKACD
ncbi:hypothetical protein [Actinomadura terrae]|uniref:hypothetical protein n=1 Tax=Actinomadura terrae TaxID=604353 RepID=UPI001FA76A67|nr:hypothetical protein [Actinomadura terrae]